MNTTDFILVASLFLWIGFVCAISFMEASLKFKAPGVTLPIALGIGRLVFHALNKVEWVFAALIGSCIVVNTSLFSMVHYIMITGVVIILLLQTLLLLPALDARAQLHIEGKPVIHSNLHLVFILAEVIKVAFLITFSIHVFLI